MFSRRKLSNIDTPFVLAIFSLVVFGLVVLISIAPSVFPIYYFYIVLGVLAFFFFANLDLGILQYYSKQLYGVSVFLLILPPLIGQVTRGVVRWIPLGALTIQPSEIVRPFLLIFFASYVYSSKLDFHKLLKALVLFAIPFFLIVIQPSLGVAILTGFGFLGVLLSTNLPKKYFLWVAIIAIAMAPLAWFAMEPYQRVRVTSFVNPAVDPLGSGYNSVQSTISVGSGKLTGRGLGKGVQTQLDFLPERQTDFVFASISEEMGFVGASIVIFAFFILLWRIIVGLEKSKNVESRAFVSGFFLSFLVQVVVHIGMNMAIFPITGIPLPLLSAGGSSFIATMIGLGMVSSSSN